MNSLRLKVLSASIAAAHAVAPIRQRLPGLLGGASLAWVLVSPAMAQTVQLDIPPGTLQAALFEISAKAGVSLKFEPDAVRNKRVQGAKGAYTVGQALEAVLKDSGLQARRVSDTVYSIEPARLMPTPAVTPAPPPAQAPARSVAPKSEDNVLHTVVIVGASTQEYVASRATTSTRTKTALGETPQTLDIVTRAMLDQQQATSIGDALRRIPGVSLTGDTGVRSQAYIRGMAAPVAVNGTTDGASGVSGAGAGSSGLSVPLVAVQGIEVLKGADAIVAGSPGNSPNFGLVNIELKKPQSTPVRDISFEAGSFGHKTIGLDMAGPLDEQKSLTYRFVGEVYKNETAPGGFTGSDGAYMAPSLMLRHEGGSLLVGAELKRARRAAAMWSYIDYDGSIADPVRPLGSRDDHQRERSANAYADWTHKLSGGWGLRVRTKLARLDAGYAAYNVNAADYTSFDLFPNSSRAVLHKADLDVAADGTVQWGQASHRLVVGANGQRLSIDVGNALDLMSVPIGQTAPRVDDYRGPMRELGQVRDTSFFIQDQVRWGDFYALLALTRSSEWGRFSTIDRRLERQGATNPSIGLLYKINDSVSLYANTRRSFSSQASVVLFDDTVAPPQRGRSRELGAKIYLNDDRLTMNVALFDNAITNSIVEQPDGAHLGPGYRSRGVEMTLAGELATGVRGTMSYTQTRLLYDQVGLPDDAFPRHGLQAFVSYSLPWEALRSWTVSGGVSARSGYNVGYLNLDYLTALMNGDAAVQPVRRIPGQSSVDANISYVAKVWSATLGVKNLMGRRLYGNLAQQLAVPFESGRVITLSGKFAF